jgi:hypothetical protein
MYYETDSISVRTASPIKMAGGWCFFATDEITANRETYTVSSSLKVATQLNVQGKPWAYPMVL